MKPSAAILAFWAALLLAVSAHAADSRTWTDTSGRKLEGSLVRQDGGKVWVLRADGREVAIEKSRLSPADLEYLQTQPASEPAPAAPTVPAAGGSSRPGLTIFKTVKIDRGLWKNSAELYSMGAAAFTQRVQTPHYLVLGTAKVKPDFMTAYADAAERTFADCQRDLPSLAALAGEKRFTLWLVDNEPSHVGVGNWLRSHGGGGGAWERMSIAGFRLPGEACDDLSAHPKAREFRVDKSSTTEHRAPEWPLRVHFLASDLLAQYLDDVVASDPAPDGARRSLNTVEMGYSFFKEWQVAGKIETEVSIGGAVVEGFQNGRRWADAVRKILKNPAGRPSLDELLKTRVTGAQPIDVACAFGMMQFFNADPARFKAFDKLLADAREAKKTPSTEDFAKALGYDTPAAFDNAWVAFMASDAFK